MNTQATQTAGETAHTPEPWEINGATVIWSPTAKAVVAQVSELRATNEVRFTEPRIGSDDLHEIAGNAHRIVACVNACAGIADPADLRRQRDELLEALQYAFRFITVTPHDKQLWETCRQAIANATKQP